ncbi:uncharacterized protein YaiL (DUF2058 family) [Natronocella acetinitrilica]|uniref:Uncharacterized protein YaiL (DUF2058 family) n=1 Tax=Natronocella acetinitrilica TaxID=414046 RepID=A0AAE3KAB8_9GAMM|nr:DUF2058 domain-containing protein [Natronocella acetinitrilica]MCP1674060.1 uncharacterized protein YaiL (DUF2058 family) [Natronocella acetinitrilica]
MNDTLRQQLLKAGVVDKKQADKVAQEARKEKKQARKKGKKAAPETPEAKRLAEEARKERAERDRALNRQREADKQQRSAAAQVEDILKQHALSMRDGDRPYNFTYGTVIRKVEVTVEQHKQLAQGRLAVVEHRKRFHLVPATVVPKLLERDASLFVALAEPSPDELDDAYKDFPIPDDLDW